MFYNTKLCRNGLVIIFVMIILGFSQLALSQDSYLLEIKVGDVIACQDQQNVAIPIYMKNYADTVAGFNLWLHLSRPDIMEFQTSFETIEYDVYWIYTDWHPQNPEIPIDSVVASQYWVCDEWDGDECIESSLQLGYYRCTAWFDLSWCLDSVFVPWTEGVDAIHNEQIEAQIGNFDTVGTLTSGWEFVETRSLVGNGLDLLITAFANQATPPIDPYTPGIGYPQLGDIPLIKIIVDVYPLEPGFVDLDAEIFVEYNILDYFNLLNENGQSLGIISENVERIRYFQCEYWLIPDVDCMYWIRVMGYECPPEGCDSTYVDTIMQTFLDVDRCCDPSSEVCYNHINEWQCPDEFGGTGVWHDGCISITYGSLHADSCMCGDIDNSFDINILDVVFLINFLYKEGLPPEPMVNADIDGDGDINILDIICLINTIYKDLNCFNCIWPD